jgi:hypothetical protein
MTRGRRRPVRRAWVPILAAALAAAAGPAELAGRRSPVCVGRPQVGLTAAARYSTWIETRASSAFDPATPHLRSMRVAYRIDAHILLPLGFASLELWTKEGVGQAVASYRDCDVEPGEVLRAFELFAASDPPKAHGLDRRGFLREALGVAPSGVAWTAYFGVMTAWPEKTLSDARKSASGPPPHLYEAIDGLSTPLDGRSSLFVVSTEGQHRDPAALWAAVRPQLDDLAPRKALALIGTPIRPLPALAFLGALQAGMRSAAAHRDRPLSPAASRVPFVHNGLVRQLELSSMARDRDRGRRAVSSGLARGAADVYELRFRIVNPGEDDFDFKLWAELPAGLGNDLLTPPLPPLGWEMRLRSYLKLVFDRVS